MPKHRIFYRLTEITERYVDVEAETLDEAEAAFDEGDVDTTESVQDDCIRFETERFEPSWPL